MTQPVTKTILCIDDDPLALQMVEDFLQEMGYSVLLALSGEKGIAIARDKQPDLILLDVNMPQMDGYAVLQTLKGDDDLQAIPVVMLTADPRPHVQTTLFNAGCDGYLKKPISGSTLFKSITEMLS